MAWEGITIETAAETQFQIHQIINLRKTRLYQILLSIQTPQKRKKMILLVVVSRNWSKQRKHLFSPTAAAIVQSVVRKGQKESPARPAVPENVENPVRPVVPESVENPVRLVVLVSKESLARPAVPENVENPARPAVPENVESLARPAVPESVESQDLRGREASLVRPVIQIGRAHV